MKRTLVVTVFLGAMIFGQVVAATAETVHRMTANIPFAFNAGGQLLPAGAYIFDMAALGGYAATGSALTIQTKDGSVFLYLNAIRSDVGNARQACTVTFSRYGDRYFLSEVQSGAIKSGLRKTSAEKELGLSHSRRADSGLTRLVLASPLAQ